MSSGTGYSYSYIDVAALERRRKLAEAAALRARLDALRGQASRIRTAGKAKVAIAKVHQSRANADVAEIDAEIAALTRHIAEGEQAVGRAMDDHWSAALGHTVRREKEPQHGKQATQATKSAAAAPRPAQHTQHSESVAAAQSAPAAAAHDNRPASADPHTARNAAVAEAAALLAEAATRCAPGDLDRIDRLCRSISEASSTAAVRERVHELRATVAESIRRGERAVQVESERGRLLALVEETPSAERDGLRAEITAAADPAGLTARVVEALERADAERKREAVARITARALQDIGCDVADDFGERLQTEGLAMAPFRDSSYGLLVRFSSGRDRIATVVVRRDDVAADPRLDTEAQREFCAKGLNGLVAGLAGAGVDLRSFYRAEPGDPPPSGYDAQAWNTPAKTARAETARVAPAARLRERRR